MLLVVLESSNDEKAHVNEGCRVSSKSPSLARAGEEEGARKRTRLDSSIPVCNKIFTEKKNDVKFAQKNPALLAPSVGVKSAVDIVVMSVDGTIMWMGLVDTSFFLGPRVFLATAVGSWRACFLCTFHKILIQNKKDIIPYRNTWIESHPFPCSFLMESPLQRRPFH